MARELTSKAATTGRVRRSPLTVRNRLSVPNQDPNYHYRIVNVKDDHVDTLISRGYEIVQDTKVGDSRVDVPSQMGAEISVGAGTKAVVMRIPKEWYNEDQAMKQAQIDGLEASMNADAAKGK